MAKIKYLLDSVILIDHLNLIALSTSFLRAHENQLAISMITRTEVLAGIASFSKTRVQGLLNQFCNLNITAVEADLAAELRRQEGWKLPDAMQAAMALHHGLLLATRNTKDFPPHRYPFVYIPYQIGN